MNKDAKIVLPGGSGLVGQNLLVQLTEKGYTNITVIDKHHKNTKILKQIFPKVNTIEADLAEDGTWEQAFDNSDVVVMLQAQIGAKDEKPFIRNNITSTKNVLNAMRKCTTVPYLVHISSSVLESEAEDFYTKTKAIQEKLVITSGLVNIVLRPTLMFGWFDRKHLGWLSRFMLRIPVFPVPGDGKFMRQPLYVKDFCGIIIACMEQKPMGNIYNISGHEKIDYIDIIRAIKKSVSAKSTIVKLPYWLFYFLLKVWALFNANPPFTVSQLKALVTEEEFEVIDWPVIFEVESTPFASAIEETFTHPIYSKYELEF